MLRLLLRNSALLVVLIITPNFGFSQTSHFEDLVLERYFQSFIRTINEHVRPHLSNKEQIQLDNIHVAIVETGPDNYMIRSDSDIDSIYFSSNVVRWIVRYSVAEIIDADPAMMDGKRHFSLYYLSTFPYVGSSVLPEDVAVLSKEQKELLHYYCSDVAFQWVIESKILFLYLHELKHQFQEYARQQKTISSNKIKEKEKAKKLLQLETECDMFAIDMIIKLQFDPREYMKAMTFLTIVKEQKFSTVEDVVFRQLNIVKYLEWKQECKKNKNDDLCVSLTKRFQELAKLYHFYLALHSDKKLNSLKNDAITRKDINAMYNLGDFFYKSTSRGFNKNVDSAFRYYSMAATLEVDHSNNGATSRQQFDQVAEYCALIAANICEYYYNDKNRAISFFERAMAIHSMFSINFYERKIADLRN